MANHVPIKLYLQPGRSGSQLADICLEEIRDGWTDGPIFLSRVLLLQCSYENSGNLSWEVSGAGVGGAFLTRHTHRAWALASETQNTELIFAIEV